MRVWEGATWRGLCRSLSAERTLPDSQQDLAGEDLDSGSNCMSLKKDPTPEGTTALGHLLAAWCDPGHVKWGLDSRPRAIVR